MSEERAVSRPTSPHGPIVYCPPSAPFPLLSHQRAAVQSLPALPPVPSAFLASPHTFCSAPLLHVGTQCSATGPHPASAHSLSYYKYQAHSRLGGHGSASACPPRLRQHGGARAPPYAQGAAAAHVAQAPLPRPPPSRTTPPPPSPPSPALHDPPLMMPASSRGAAPPPPAPGRARRQRLQRANPARRAARGERLGTPADAAGAAPRRSSDQCPRTAAGAGTAAPSPARHARSSSGTGPAQHPLRLGYRVVRKSFGPAAAALLRVPPPPPSPDQPPSPRTRHTLLRMRKCQRRPQQSPPKALTMSEGMRVAFPQLWAQCHTPSSGASRPAEAPCPSCPVSVPGVSCNVTGSPFNIHTCMSLRPITRRGMQADVRQTAAIPSYAHRTVLYTSMPKAPPLAHCSCCQAAQRTSHGTLPPVRHERFKQGDAPPAPG